MTAPDLSPRFESLRAHAARVSAATLTALIAADPARATGFALRVGPLYANFARQRYDRDALDALFALADDVAVADRLRALFDGAVVNVTEGRAALHTALRSELSDASPARAARDEALSARQRMAVMVEALQDSPVTDI
ncbi:MAG TPA: glucose-6-phosphate isomerase, partial [Lysobacter sp.]|nr:glucose-6-phosphate isomerase [Lysobacter sp.]